MSEWDEVVEPYNLALQEFRAAERALASARWKLEAAERARKVVWDKLVAGARVRDPVGGAGPCGADGDK